MPDQETLQRWFEYRNGELYWKIALNSKTKKVGGIVGRGKGTYDSSCGKKISIKVGINGKAYCKHRLIFKLIHGYCPETISFIDGNPWNYKIENLQDASTKDKD